MAVLRSEGDRPDGEALYTWSECLLAAPAMAALPITILYAVTQHGIIDGIMQGAVTGMAVSPALGSRLAAQDIAAVAGLVGLASD
jgi:hypothetical protein